MRAGLLCGVGAHFCAGHDLDAFSAWPQGPLDPVARFMHALARLRKPIVAAVQGSAAGVGFTALLHAEWVCCTEDARFIAPFLKLGNAPEAASTLLLVRQVGAGRARQVLLGGRVVTGREAVDWSLASEIVHTSDPADLSVLHTRALEAARRLSTVDGALFAQTKTLLLPPLAEVLARIHAEIDLINRQVLLRSARS